MLLQEKKEKDPLKRKNKYIIRVSDGLGVAREVVFALEKKGQGNSRSSGEKVRGGGVFPPRKPNGASAEA